MDRLHVCLTHKTFIPCRREGDCIWSDDPVDVAHVREYQQGTTPADPSQAREALDNLILEALVDQDPWTESAPEAVSRHLLDPANRAAVLRALGLHEERAIDKPGMRGVNPQRRWATDWEDYTDE